MSRKWIGPLFICSLVSSSVFATFANMESAHADRRIVPGAAIPLALPGKKPVETILSTCLKEETLGSLYPSLATVGPAPGTSAHEDAQIEEDIDRTGDEFNWTVETKWLPSISYSLDFLEWKDVNTSIERHLAMEVSTSAYGPTYDETDLDVSFETDAEGSDVDVSLSLTGPLPYLRTEAVGRRSCSINEWGRDTCAEDEEKITSAQLVIPAQFVSSGMWTNSRTGHPTMKSFSFFRYAECLLWHWEN